MILLRPSAEIFLKSANVRRKWERKLISEIKRAIGDVRLRKGGGRIWIEEDITPEARDRLRYTFGIHSFSVCKRCSLQQLEEQVLSFWDERWGEKSGFSFAVRVKREGQHDFTSQEMAARIGALILDSHPDLRVDLKNPDYVIFVEIRDLDCYIFDEMIEGAGGLPPGVEGRVVALFSGGVDSAVASWMMMRRGCEVIPVHLDPGDFGAGEGIERAEEVASFLQRYQRNFKLKIIDHSEFLTDLIHLLRSVRLERYTCLLCKRRMYRIAEEVAREVKARGIVTGESLGQVASQTLDNLFVLDQAVNIPVFRPLIGLDKNEIEGWAREIGLYEICVSTENRCLAAPRRPSTRGDLEKILDLEQRLYGDRRQNHENG